MKHDLIEGMEMYPVTEANRATIGRQNIWHYMINTDIGLLHIVQHENTGLEVIDDYMGRDSKKAEDTFKKSVIWVLNEKR